MTEPGFTIHMEHLQGMEFKVRFDWDGVPELTLDEPKPMGAEHGPNASRLLAAAVGNCLTASLFFCLARSRVEAKGMKTAVTASTTRTEKGRLRIGGFAVRIELPEGLAGSAVERCLGLFEDFCVVTASVRHGIPVSVEVVDAGGATLHTAGA